MTNAQCSAYTIIALSNLIKAGMIKTSRKNIYQVFDHELYGIFDMVGEEEVEEKAAQILEDRG